MHIKKRILLFFIAIMVINIALSGCFEVKEVKEVSKNIAIAEQFGLAYAPLQIMKELKLLEKNLPGANISWKQLGNTAAIREAMLAKEIDIGFMAIPPFLIGWDKGMDWKICSGLSMSPVGLVVNKQNIKSIRDFTDKDRIVLPQPGSVQHILLSMACEKEFNDPKKLDNILVTMAHPDGMNALLAKKDITAHFTTEPYLSKELEFDGVRQLLSGKDILGGDFTFIVGVSTVSFHDDKKAEYKALIKSLDEAIEYMKNNKSETIKLLSKAYSISEQEIENYLASEGTHYDKKVKGIEEFADFMKKSGYISETPKNLNDVIWEADEYEK